MISQTIYSSYFRRKKTAPGRNNCGITDVFHEFAINVIFKQLKLFFMSIADLIQSLNGTYCNYNIIIS